MRNGINEMGIPEFMTAAVLTGHGGPEKIVIRDDIPVPKPGTGEVLIKVGACGMNNTDINARIGWYSRSVSSGTDLKGGPDDPVGLEYSPDYR